jgi:hypothetical protein
VGKQVSTEYDVVQARPFARVRREFAKMDHSIKLEWHLHVENRHAISLEVTTKDLSPEFWQGGMAWIVEREQRLIEVIRGGAVDSIRIGCPILAESGSMFRLRQTSLDDDLEIVRMTQRVVQE